jgi:hypothetical protein
MGYLSVDCLLCGVSGRGAIFRGPLDELWCEVRAVIPIRFLVRNATLNRVPFDIRGANECVIASSQHLGWYNKGYKLHLRDRELMRKRTLALWLSLPTLLAGCAGGSATAQPAATVTQTVTVTAAPSPSPTPTPTRSGPLPLGTTAQLPSGGSVTVFEHRKGVEPQDVNQEAIDIQVCIPTQTSSSPATIYQRFWSLRDAANRTYTPASTTWQHPGAVPGFWPPEQQVKTGDCYRAWVIIEGSNTTPMTTARYSNDSTGVILDWALPQ